MGLINKFKKLFKKKETEVTPQSNQEKQEEIIQELDTRPILKDKEGNDLVCEFCNNQDNETNKYYPIREGEKKVFSGKVFHIKCFRYFKKHIREFV